MDCLAVLARLNDTAEGSCADEQRTWTERLAKSTSADQLSVAADA
jgi:hypothetical protein